MAGGGGCGGGEAVEACGGCWVEVGWSRCGMMRCQIVHESDCLSQAGGHWRSGHAGGGDVAPE